MKTFILLISISLSSCAIFKNSKSSVLVEGKIDIHTPYCGGMKPTTEIAKGTYAPYANSVFYVKSQMQNDKKSHTILKFTTDSEGKYSFKIKKGAYIVIQEDKTLDFDSYLAKYKTINDKFLEYIGDKSAKEHYERIDFSMDIQENKEINYSYKTRCHVGFNPLYKYIGPLVQ